MRPDQTTFSMDSPTPPPVTLNNDAEHLKLLAVFHYVVAALGAAFACFPLIHVVLGAALVVSPTPAGQNAPPAAVGYLFMFMGGFFVLLGWAAAICTFVSGRCLAKQRRRLFSLVMGGVLCAFVPFGTVLGVFTLIVLSRNSVQQLYAEVAARTDR